MGEEQRSLALSALAALVRIEGRWLLTGYRWTSLSVHGSNDRVSEWICWTNG